MLAKWLPGYEEDKQVDLAVPSATGSMVMKHPKSLLIEFSTKNKIPPPKTTFSEDNSIEDRKFWIARVQFSGKVTEARSTKKKDAELEAFQKMMRLVISQ